MQLLRLLCDSGLTFVTTLCWQFVKPLRLRLLVHTHTHLCTEVAASSTKYQN